MFSSSFSLVNLLSKSIPKLVNPTLVTSQTSTNNLSTLCSMLAKTSLIPVQQSLLKQPEVLTLVQKRFNWGYKGRMMLKDIKRRELLRKTISIRIRLQALRANSILPKAFKKEVAGDLSKLPIHSSIRFITNRCGFTSKPGGCLHRWRLSRHVWRDQGSFKI
jgi:hypothetical protein